MSNLMYSNNADIKYPLSDFHEADVPNDILLDMSLSLPEGLEPVAGVVRVGLDFAFLSIENKSDRTPICSVLVQAPSLARVYPMDMDVDGFGWVVFGPGAVQGQPYYSGNLAVDLDPECVVLLRRTAPVFNLTMNGFRKQLENILFLASGTELLLLSVADGVVYIDRNDEILSTEDRTAFTDQGIGAEGIADRVLFTLGGIGPDADGNVDVDIIGCVRGCLDTREVPVLRGDTGLGVSGELPLDIYTEREYTPGDPCAPGESSSEPGPSEAADPFEGCVDIIKVDILDAADADKPVGTLYTVERDEDQ